MEEFELSAEAMRVRRSSKWRHYPEHVIPAWVADMDYAVAEPVQRALKLLIEHGDYGYAWRAEEDSLAAAFVARMRDRFDWAPDPDGVYPIADLVQAMVATVMAFSEPGDGVVIQTPIYPPFISSVQDTGRRRVDNPLRDDGTRFVLDLESLRRVVDDATKIIMVCNPHNPTGRVFERAELEAIGALAVERDLVVVCDEIHADLAYPGHRHIPLGSLAPEIAERTVTLTSATKGFNIAGLRCAITHFGSPELKARFERVFPARVLGGVNCAGLDATVAAWRHGQPWLDRVMDRLRRNRDRVAEWVRTQAPAIHHYPPEATYLAWLDCRALDLPATSPHEFFLKEARVGLNDGAHFGPPGVTCVRLNFATSAQILEEILGRMGEALRRVGQPEGQSW